MREARRRAEGVSVDDNGVLDVRQRASGQLGEAEAADESPEDELGKRNGDAPGFDYDARER